MKILVINDDGINAPGIWAAARALRQVGEVVVVAPDRQQSGVGACLTLHAPVKAGEWAVNQEFKGEGDGLYPVSAFSVEGTPGDSCILALESLVQNVDLVVSGVNAGSNVGYDVMVSGTVGGAVQSYVRGINTIAISVAAVTNTKYDIAEKILKPLAEKFVDYTGDTLFLNVNIPKIEMNQVAGVKVTRLAHTNPRYLPTLKLLSRTESPIQKVRAQLQPASATSHNPIHCRYHLKKKLVEGFSSQMLPPCPLRYN